MTAIEQDFPGVGDNKTTCPKYNSTLNVSYCSNYDATPTLIKAAAGSPRYVLSLDQFDSSINGATHLYTKDFLLGKVDINIS